MSPRPSVVVGSLNTDLNPPHTRTGPASDHCHSRPCSLRTDHRDQSLAVGGRRRKYPISGPQSSDGCSRWWPSSPERPKIRTSELGGSDEKSSLRSASLKLCPAPGICPPVGGRLIGVHADETVGRAVEVQLGPGGLDDGGRCWGSEDVETGATVVTGMEAGMTPVVGVVEAGGLVLVVLVGTTELAGVWCSRRGRVRRCLRMVHGSGLRRGQSGQGHSHRHDQGETTTVRRTKAMGNLCLPVTLLSSSEAGMGPAGGAPIVGTGRGPGTATSSESIDTNLRNQELRRSCPPPIIRLGRSSGKRAGSLPGLRAAPSRSRNVYQP